MGWWRSSREGASLQMEDTGLVWGDGPADILGEAIEKVREEYRSAHGREPKAAELRAGLEFSLLSLPDEADLSELD